MSSDEGFFVIALREDNWGTNEDFARYVKKELDDETLDPEEFLGMEQRLPVQRLREMWCNISLAVFRRSSFSFGNIHCKHAGFLGRHPLLQLHSLQDFFKQATDLTASS